MSSTCRHRDDCRLCGSRELVRVLELAPTPPANAFVPENKLAEPQESFPLDVWLCGNCKHIQLLDIVDPAVLFGDYPYVSGTSPVFVRHFEDYAAGIVTRFSLRRDDLVVDVGSNDGTLLKPFQAAGMKVLGIDPAQAIAAAASASGIETLPDFFTRETAAHIGEQHGQAMCITANNVFAHIDDLAGTADAVRELLAPEGIFVFEVSYFVDVFEKTLFDTIYHEHLDYHTVGPLPHFFAGHGLDLFAVERIDTHGGSLRGFVQLAGGRHERLGVEALVDEEIALGVDREEILRDYSSRIADLGHKLGALLAGLRDDGKRIAGYGAPAKATTLMHHFGIGPKEIEFIVDDNPLKQSLYSPGLHVPVLPSISIAEREPDYLLILAWNFAEPIMEKCADFAQGGGRFIVPLPDIRVI